MTTLASYLLPTDPALTRSVVRRSGLARLEEFVHLAKYLASVPAYEDSYREALAALEQFDEEEPDVLFRRLASPVFRGWLALCGGVRRYGVEDPGLAIHLQYLSTMRFRLSEGEYSTTMRSVGGYIATWDVGLVASVPGYDWVRVERTANRLVISTPDGRELVRADNVTNDFEADLETTSEGIRLLSAPYLPGSRVALRNDVPQLRLQLSGSVERNAAIVFGAVDNSSESYPDFDAGPFLEAGSIISEAWPEEYADFQETLHVVVPRSAPRGWNARGMTVSSHQGAVWLFVRDVLELVEHLVHEQSHIKLRYVEESFPILERDQKSERFRVGWRRDPRPLVGIYEGVYVHAHVLLALLACARRGAFSGVTAQRCLDRAEHVAGELRDGLEILVEHARFTAVGRAFAEWAMKLSQDLYPPA